MTDDAWVTAAANLEKLRADNDRLQYIADKAREFVLAHCALEVLAEAIGGEAASQHPLNSKVIYLHVQLEVAVLGETNVPGRRKPS